MAYQQCRFCPFTVNGETKRLDHERNTHPKLYWEAKSAQCRYQIKRLMDEADRYDQRARDIPNH